MSNPTVFIELDSKKGDKLRLLESTVEEDCARLNCFSSNPNLDYGSVVMDVEGAKKLRDALEVFINLKSKEPNG